MRCFPGCRTLTKINQITPRYFKVTASGGFPELTVPLEVFPSPGVSSPDTAGTWIPRREVTSFTHPSSSAAGKHPACTGPQEHCRAQSEPEPAESTGISWEQSGMAPSLGSTKLTKAEKDLGAGGTVQPFPTCLEGKAPTLGTSLSGSPWPHWRDQRAGIRCHPACLLYLGSTPQGKT